MNPAELCRAIHTDVGTLRQAVDRLAQLLRTAEVASEPDLVDARL